MSEAAVEQIKVYQVTHDAFNTADNNYTILEDQLKSLAQDLKQEGILDNFRPASSIRSFLDTTPLEGLL